MWRFNCVTICLKPSLKVVVVQKPLVGLKQGLRSRTLSV